MTNPHAAPRIVTFYSYKGGTGRSMALANVAWILAANGKRVAVIDWDLEAPGLHRYFHPYLDDPGLLKSPGIIDFVMAFAREAIKPAKGKLDPSWYLPYANLLRYASSLRYDFPGQGTIDFIPSGRQGSDYAARVNSFNWSAFYENQQGGLFLEAAKQSLRSYDWVLVDSRTGVSDTSGICTVQMPQILVVCFTPNAQSIEGASAIARSADDQRTRSDATRTLRVLPVMTRVLGAEKERVEAAKRDAREHFDDLLWHLGDSAARDRYWGRIPVPQEPFYAFEEVLAVFGDEAGRPDTMLASMEHLAGYVVQAWADTKDADVRPLPLPAMTEAARQAELRRFMKFARPSDSPPFAPAATKVAVGPTSRASVTGQAIAPGYLFYVSFAQADYTPYLQRFCEDLEQSVRNLTGGSLDRIMFFRGKVMPVEPYWLPRANILADARTMLALVSPHYLRSEYCGKEWQLFSERTPMGLQPPILPVQWAPIEGEPPSAISQLQIWGKEEKLTLNQLARQRRPRYFELINQAAGLLVQFAKAAPPARVVPSSDSISNAFSDLADQSRPDILVLVVLAGNSREMAELHRDRGAYGDDEDEWSPWSGRTTVAALAEEAIADAHLSVIKLSAGERGLVTTTRLTLVVVDLWSLGLERVRTQLAHFQRNQPGITGYVLVSEAAKTDEEEEANVRKLLVRTLDEASRSSKKFREVRSEAEFSLAVTSVVTALRLELIATAAGARTSAAKPKLL